MGCYLAAVGALALVVLGLAASAFTYGRQAGIGHSPQPRFYPIPHTKTLFMTLTKPSTSSVTSPHLMCMRAGKQAPSEHRIRPAIANGYGLESQMQDSVRR